MSYTPKWFDYSSMSYDELKYINTYGQVDTVRFTTCTDPSRPHCAALCVQTGDTAKVQLTPFMSWKKLYQTIIHPLHQAADAR